MSIMFDIETMGTDPDAAIIQIGAVEFRRDGSFERVFEATVDLQSCLNNGMSVTADTIDWWASQKRELARCRPVPIDIALAQFEEWFLESKSGDVWANGAAFDASVIQSAYRRILERNAPWPFHRTLDLRTLLHVAESDGERVKYYNSGNTHNAVEDCLNQVRQLVRAKEKIERWREGGAR